MKKALFYVMPVLFYFQASGTGREKMLLKGDVKSVAEWNYEAKGRAGAPAKGKLIVPGGRDFNYYLFNEKGNLVEERRMINDSVVSGKRITGWKKDSVIYIKAYDGDVETEWMEYERDQKNRITAEKVYEKNKLLHTCKYDYNDSENTLTWQILNPSNEIFKHKAIPQDIYFFNSKGLPDSVHHYSFINPTTMKKARKSEWKYDDKGRLVSYADYFINDSLHRETVWFYSDSLPADSSMETEYLFSRVLKQTEKKLFDKSGNPVKKVFYMNETNSTETTAWQYEFDEKGNWIRRITLVNGRPVSLTERKIEYFATAP